MMTVKQDKQKGSVFSKSSQAICLLFKSWFKEISKKWLNRRRNTVCKVINQRNVSFLHHFFSWFWQIIAMYSNVSNLFMKCDLTCLTIGITNVFHCLYDFFLFICLMLPKPIAWRQRLVQFWLMLFTHYSQHVPMHIIIIIGRFKNKVKMIVITDRAMWEHWFCWVSKIFVQDGGFDKTIHNGPCKWIDHVNNSKVISLKKGWKCLDL